MDAAQPYLVAVDVDGTLVDTEFADTIAPPVLEAIARLRDSGHVLALCTGRNVRSAADVVEHAGGVLRDVPQILLNGAMVVAPPRILCRAGLSREILSRLVELFRAHGTLPLLFTGEQGEHLLLEELPPNSVLARYLQRRRDRIGALTTVPDLAAHLPEVALEVGTIDAAETIRALTDAVAEALGDRVHLVNTRSLLSQEEYLWLEVYPPRCNKGTALELLARELGFPRERVIAVGDNFNDLEMFAAAGHRVAMGNAPPEVQDLADRVVPPVREHGAVEILDDIAAGRFPPDGRS